MAPQRALALVGNDPSLIAAVRHHLQSALGHAIDVVPFEEARVLLGPENAGLLVLIAGSAEEAAAARALVQEIRLRDLTPRVLLLETEETAGAGWADLDPYVSNRLSWPEHGRGLVSWVRRHLPNAGTLPPTTPAPRDEMARRLLGTTPSLAPLLDSLTLAAAHPVTVLIDGETGTGKTHLARLIHDFSSRRRERFVAVPCGALAANLVESEFFGHARGAFTGADAAKVGKFAAAGRGTILLDEIDALGLEQQANLLRVIETGEFEPVGSNDTQHSEARVIVATNWNLEQAVAQGYFRRDLYYRLNVLPFYLPPLRDRPEDIAPLARGLVARFAVKFDKSLFCIAGDVLATLATFAWPGNIRQLENVLQQAVLVCDGPELRTEHLPPLPAGDPTRRAGRPTLARDREASERCAIRRALEEAGHSRTRAAAALGVSRVTLYKKMKKYGFLNASGQAPRERAALA